VETSCLSPPSYGFILLLSYIAIPVPVFTPKSLEKLLNLTFITIIPDTLVPIYTLIFEFWCSSTPLCQSFPLTTRPFRCKITPNGEFKTVEDYYDKE